MKNLKYFIKGIQETSKQMKGVNLKTTKKNLVCTVEAGNKNLSVYHVPDINKLGLMFSAVTKSFIIKKPYIMVDDNFLECRAEAQEACLQHEVGHYVLGHLDELNKVSTVYSQYVLIGKLACAKNDEERNLLMEGVLSNRKYSQETEADMYALKSTSKAGILALIVAMYSVSPSPELEDRYANIAGDIYPSLKEILALCEDKILNK